MTTFQKLIGFSLLIISLSIAYYFIMFLPSKEAQRAKQIMVERLEKERGQQEANEKKAETQKQQQISLEECISDAHEGYSKQWAKECKAQGLMSTSCIEIVNMDVSEYMKINNITASHEAFTILESTNKLEKEQEECMCRLPSYYADKLEETRKEYKNDCYKKYPSS